MPRWAFLLCIIVVYQILLYLLFRSLSWLFGGGGGWILAAAIFIIGDSILLISLFRFVPNVFTLMGITIAVLWFWTLAAIVTGVLYFILPDKFHTFEKVFLVFVFFALLGYGWFNAHSPVVKNFQVTLNKPASDFRIAVVSDIHLGDLVGNHMLGKLVSIMQKQRPDVILLAGDIIDYSPEPYLAQHMYEVLGKLSAPDGVYAALGNHEFYGGVESNAAAIRQSGITLLRDDSSQIGDKFVVIGRDDKTDTARLPLSELVAKVNTNLPILVMDHQPNDIEKASELPIDIQVSGHTHRGQIFPANLITKAMFIVDYGYKKINNVNFFTTSGFGTWGPPFRLGSRSEVFIIDVKGSKS